MSVVLSFLSWSSSAVERDDLLLEPRHLRAQLIDIALQLLDELRAAAELLAGRDQVLAEILVAELVEHALDLGVGVLNFPREILRLVLAERT